MDALHLARRAHDDAIAAAAEFIGTRPFRRKGAMKNNHIGFIASRCAPEPNTGCWLWTMSLNESGYGAMRLNRRNIPASRAMWIACFGDPGELIVLHRCDTPACVNPGHLFLGTHADNKYDCMRKGRHARGESQHKARLTERDVLAIRAMTACGDSLRTIAGRFGVASKTIWDVVHGHTWAHLPGAIPTTRRDVGLAQDMEG